MSGRRGRGRRGRARRGPLFLLAVVVLAGVSLLVVAGLQGTVSYYRTPSDVAAHTTLAGRHIRLGGRVVPGSLRRVGAETDFTITDGRRQVTVVQRGAPPGTFREGQDAVVEGVLDPDGVLRADRVIVKHSNQYQPATGGPVARDG